MKLGPWIIRILVESDDDDEEEDDDCGKTKMTPIAVGKRAESTMSVLGLNITRVLRGGAEWRQVEDKYASAFYSDGR